MKRRVYFQAKDGKGLSSLYTGNLSGGLRKLKKWEERRWPRVSAAMEGGGIRWKVQGLVLRQQRTPEMSENKSMRKGRRGAPWPLPPILKGL